MKLTAAIMERWVVILGASLLVGLGAVASTALAKCPPDWTRKTTNSGTQIGTGEPGGVPPVGCR